jgi:hypothetical protein
VPIDRYVFSFRETASSADNVNFKGSAQRWARFVVRLSQGTWRSMRKRVSVGSIPGNLAENQDMEDWRSRSTDIAGA